MALIALNSLSDEEIADLVRGRPDGIIWLNPLPNAIRWTPPHCYLQRPLTDDMRQMLDDIGIEWPEFQPVSYDGRTFRFLPECKPPPAEPFQRVWLTKDYEIRWDKIEIEEVYDHG